MSFGGAVGAMIASLKNNKRDRVSAFDKLKNYKEKKSKLVFNNKASKEDLKKLKKRMQKENQRSFLINVLLYGTLFAIIIYFFWFYKY